jgi:hypothetical protein
MAHWTTFDIDGEVTGSGHVSKSRLFNYNSQFPSLIYDELYEDVGTGGFILGDTKRAFLATDFYIETDDSGGTILEEGTDYQLIDEDFNYTEEVGATVYTRVQILNAAYQTGPLYISYKCCGSYTDVDVINNINDNFSEYLEENYSCLFYPSYQNLTAKPNTSNPTYQVDIAWDELRIENRRTTSQSFTLDITQSGALGLDTGAEAVSTWYYIWAICNDAGTTVSVILSASATSPTLPSGYTKKRLISAVFNLATGHFRGFQQKDANYTIQSVTVISAGTAGSCTAVSLAAIIPINSRVVHGALHNDSVGWITYVYNTSSSYGQKMCGSGGGSTYANICIPIIDAQIIYYNISGGHAYIYISGCELNI